MIQRPPEGPSDAPDPCTFDRFGEYLLGLRRWKNMSLRDAAEAAELSPTYISRLERDLVERPTQRVLDGLGQAFNIPGEALRDSFERLHHPGQPLPPTIDRSRSIPRGAPPASATVNWNAPLSRKPSLFAVADLIDDGKQAHRNGNVHLGINLLRMALGMIHELDPNTISASDIRNNQINVLTSLAEWELDVRQTHAASLAVNKAVTLLCIANDIDEKAFEGPSAHDGSDEQVLRKVPSLLLLAFARLLRIKGTCVAVMGKTADGRRLYRRAQQLLEEVKRRAEDHGLPRGDALSVEVQSQTLINARARLAIRRGDFSEAMELVGNADHHRSIDQGFNPWIEHTRIRARMGEILAQYPEIDQRHLLGFQWKWRKPGTADHVKPNPGQEQAREELRDLRTRTEQVRECFGHESPLHDERNAVDALVTVCRINLMLGEALDDVASATASIEAYGEPHFMPLTRVYAALLRAELHCHHGAFDAAIDCAESALRICRAIEDEFEKARTLRALGAAILLKAQTERAYEEGIKVEEHLAAARDIAKVIKAQGEIEYIEAIEVFVNGWLAQVLGRGQSLTP